MARPDEETISSQIVPHVSSLGSRDAVVDYLTTLIGSEQADFIAHYADSRFGNPASKAWNGASTSTAHRPNQKERAKRSSSPTQQRHQHQKQQQQQQQWKAAVPLNAQQQQAAANRSRQVKQEEIRLSSDASNEIEELERQLSFLDINLKPRLGTRCFCATSLHPLSDLAPLCHSCGLIHCSLNSPLACAACRQPLMSNAVREDLVATVQARRRTVIEAEVDRLRAEQARRDGVAFPQLNSGPSSLLSNVPSHMRTTPQGLHPASWANKAGRGSSLPAADELARKIEEAYTFDPSSISQSRDSQQSADPSKYARTITIGSNGKVTKVQSRRPAPRHYNQPKSQDLGATTADGDEDVDLLALARSPEYAGWIDTQDDYVRKTSKAGAAALSSNGASGPSEERPFRRSTTVSTQPKWVPPL